MEILMTIVNGDIVFDVVKSKFSKFDIPLPIVRGLIVSVLRQLFISPVTF